MPCRSRRTISLALAGLVWGLATAAGAQTFTVQSGEPAGYLLRDGRRFFAIGTRVDGIKVKPVDEMTFSSLREIFNTLWITIRDIDDPKHLYPDGIFTRLDYVRHDDGLFLAGDLPWRLQAEPGCIIDLNRDGIFQASEQRAAHKRVTPAAARRAMETIYREVNPPGGPKRSMIYYLMDEPDAGYATDAHWAFTDSLLKRFYDQRRKGTLAYIDLGPVTGSKLLYEKKYPLRAPDKGSAAYFASLRYSHATPEENIRETTRTYAPAADILGINSYDATNRKPSLLGEAVTVMQEASGYKPIWPWVSAEAVRYSSPQSMYSTVRPQLFSALIHGASGILFYNDQSVVARSSQTQACWDRMYDLVKEVVLYRDVLEDFTTVSFRNTGAVQWRRFSRGAAKGGSSYYFVANTTADDQSLVLPNGAPLRLGENECGVWLETGSATRRLTPLANLSFEIWQGAAGAQQPSQWQVELPDGTAAIRSAAAAKLGDWGLQLEDRAAGRDRTAMLRQSIPCAGGETYRGQAWCRFESGSPQRLLLQFHDRAGKLLLEKESRGPAIRSGWQLVRTIARAPAAAESLTILLCSAGGKQQGRSSWDDLLLRLE